MRLIINEDRRIIALGTWGTQNENNYEIIEFEFPQKFEEYNKRIVYYLNGEKKWDIIQNNKAYITNAITRYKRVKAYVWCTLGDTITLHYICNGTENGDYYFSYNNENHYFTITEVQKDDELIYDVTNNTLKLKDTTIETSLTGSGDKLEFSQTIESDEDFRTKLFEMQFYENENADSSL